MEEVLSNDSSPEPRTVPNSAADAFRQYLKDGHTDYRQALQQEMQKARQEIEQLARNHAGVQREKNAVAP